MGRSEFAAPYVSITLDQHGGFIPCSVENCKCADSIADKPRDTVITAETSGSNSNFAQITNIQQLLRSQETEPEPVDRQPTTRPARAVLSFDDLMAQNDDGLEVDELPEPTELVMSPTQSLPVTSPLANDAAAPLLTGRVTLRAISKNEDELPGTPDLEVSLYGREHVDVYSREGAIACSEPIVTITQVLPFKPRASPTQSTVYDFSIPLVSWLPPTATPTWGAVDYRIVARFKVDPALEKSHHSSMSRHAATAHSQTASENSNEVVMGEWAAQKKVPVHRIHGFLGEGKMQHKVVTTLDGNKSFEIAVDAPERAQVDSGKISVSLSVKSLNPDILTSQIKGVKIMMGEFRTYKHYRMKDGKKVIDDKQELTVLGSSSTLTLDPQGRAQATVPFSSGPGGADGIPIIVHPRFTSVNMKVTHNIVIKVFYIPKESHTPPAAGKGGFLNNFKKMVVTTASQSKEESAVVPIMTIAGPPPAKIGNH